MIKTLTNLKNGSRLITLGISEGNVGKLKQGQPIYIHLDELGIEAVDLMIHYGETEKAIITEFQEKGLIPDDTEL